MISKSVTIVTACSSFFFIIQIFTPKAVVALRKMPDFDEFMIENQRTRTRTRQNYVVQRESNDDMSGGMENIGPAYITDPLDPEANQEELPALIVDYANMIRNDIILLDKSVETRTRKRGNVGIQNDHEGSPSSQCNCESNRYPVDLTEKYGPTVFPMSVMTVECSDSICPKHYHCQRHHYYITILKKRTSIVEESVEPLPSELQKKFMHEMVTRRENITIGCSCVLSGLEKNQN